MIPRRLVRTVPAVTTADAERLWLTACALHPDWEHVTLRDPVDPSGFPITSPYWPDCETGAQLADLIRAEELLHRGGWYIDSDVLMLKPLDTLCGLEAVAGWEDRSYIPNAVLGFRPGHQALQHVLDRAIARRFMGTWTAGVGVTTEVFGGRDDVTLLPPQAFYPVHWRQAHDARKACNDIDWSAAAADNPWSWAIHLYAASWH